MYHRFEENKYPSTNIRLIDFKKHLQLIKNKNFHLVNANNFEEDMKNKKDKKKLLITIDDAFLSFYNNAWPLLKKEKIPFILFVSTREVGKSNYMTWQQIREISKENFVHIGNHSHSHEYLVDLESEKIINDIKKSIKIFKREIGYNSEFFSYPFGEYSLEFKSIIKNLGFNFAFGQHSGVVDETKDFFELPRFPINEKYGSLKRFKTLMNTLPLRVKSILPSEKYINDKTNPPKIIINFYNDVDNLKSINCYSNEGDKWRSSEIKFINDFKLEIVIQEKFTTERGRVNCSLRENNGSWRWLGMQFVIAEK
jgi:peptidoglycan/xylan/chitin deacetylase (PgdA/CDA1 family)